MGLLSVAAERQPELMDDPGLAEADHLHALEALRTINVLSRTTTTLAAAVKRLAATAGPASLEIVDLACGGGDVTRGCARRVARARGGTVRMVGVDMSTRALDRARSDLAADRRLAALPACRVEFAERDLVTLGCPPCDVAVSSLFLHHLDDDAAAALLRSAAAACRLGFAISDLVRSRLGLALAVLGTGLFSTSRVARVDGPLSVRAARTPREYRRLLDAAGLATATIRRTWPERVVITWRRDAAA